MSLTAARTDFGEALAAAGRTVHHTAPDVIDAPAVVLQPGDPYLEHGGTFGDDYTVTLEAFLALELTSAEDALDHLEPALADLMADVQAAGWWVTSVGQPGPYHTSEWVAYGVLLTVQTHTTP